MVRQSSIEPPFAERGVQLFFLFNEIGMISVERGRDFSCGNVTHPQGNKLASLGCTPGFALYPQGFHGAFGPNDNRDLGLFEFGHDDFFKYVSSYKACVPPHTITLFFEVLCEGLR